MKGSSRLAQAVAIAGSACAFALGAACRAPTQIEVVVLAADRATCDAIDVAHVFAGAPDVSDTAAAAAVAVHRCAPQSDGSGTRYFAGSIIVTPSGRHDARILVRAYAGMGGSSELCAETNYASCIVARRLVSFREGLPLKLPIVLYGECKGQVCGGQTCVSGGVCRDAESPCTTDGYCSPDVPPSPDGGLVSVDGSIVPVDGSVLDGAVPVDGSVPLVDAADAALDCRVVACPKFQYCANCKLDEYRCLPDGVQCF